MTVVAVIAKECVPGRVKTRLQPAFTAEEAALIASAALTDTLRIVSGLPASRRILYWEGGPTPEEAKGWDVQYQSIGPLDERIADLFDSVSEPLLLLGMDTPHLDPLSLAGMFQPWDDVDAWFGPANDGGFWALGLREPKGALVRGVRMSSALTGHQQRRRLDQAGLRVATLPTLTDIDTADDLTDAALSAPTLAAMMQRLRPSGVLS